MFHAAHLSLFLNLPPASPVLPFLFIHHHHLLFSFSSFLLFGHLSRHDGLAACPPKNYIYIHTFPGQLIGRLLTSTAPFISCIPFCCNASSSFLFIYFPFFRHSFVCFECNHIANNAQPSTYPRALLRCPASPSRFATHFFVQ